MTVYGTRPEAIKLAPVVSSLAQDPRFRSVVVSTGQHKEMLEQVNLRFGIEPDYDMALMRPGQSLNELVSRALSGLDSIVAQESPDVVVVQGDTSTAMAAAIAGFHRGAKVVHLEAGLRTGDIHSPFPEEANRKIIAQVASLHLAPTREAGDNLLRENIPTGQVAVTGNTVIDALLTASKWNVTFEDPRIRRIASDSENLVLVTTHRRENLDAMEQIAGAVEDLARLHPGCYFVLPLHLNPRVRDVVLPPVEGLPNVIITDPLPYDQFIALMNIAVLVLTDSGGVQEEAPSLGKPVLLMRDNTERQEVISPGAVQLVGTNRERIVMEASRLLQMLEGSEADFKPVHTYGDGRAAERTIAAIAQLVGVGERMADFDPGV